MAGAVTTAVRCRRFEGVLKPAGTPTSSSVVPGPTGSKAVLTLDWFPEKDNGLTVIVPTAVSELVIGTLTGAIPARRGCPRAKASVDGLSRPELIENAVLGAKEVVLLLIEGASRYPEGTYEE